MLTGDLNAHNTIWGSIQTDQRGQIIESFISIIHSKTFYNTLWNKRRSINNKRVYIPIPAILDQNNQLQTTEETIAETFSDLYYKVIQEDLNLRPNWNLLLENVDEMLLDDINTLLVTLM